MSGPVHLDDLGGAPAPPDASPRVVLSESRAHEVGGLPVRRALPNPRRRTVGAWCFVDHAGPLDLGRGRGVTIGPHPHMGLQTVTWVLEGSLVHTDSLGSEQVVRPGQLNLMTAGRGVSHAERAGHATGTLHAVQLWVAQPSGTRHGPPAFEHHPTLPSIELAHGVATVVVGEMGGAASPARRDTPHVGADLSLARGASAVPLDPSFEYALVVTDGAVSVDGELAVPGRLAYLGEGREQLDLVASEPVRLLLLGGVPFHEQLFMWWNLVARGREEIDEAYLDWAHDTGRFGHLGGASGRIEAPRPMWWPPEGR